MKLSPKYNKTESVPKYLIFLRQPLQVESLLRVHLVSTAVLVVVAAAEATLVDHFRPVASDTEAVRAKNSQAAALHVQRLLKARRKRDQEVGIRAPKVQSVSIY